MHYDLGGSHPLIGRSAPDFELEDGSRLGDLLHDGRGLLLDFRSGVSLAAVCTGLQDRLSYVSAPASDDKGLSALLVRPDGFVAWATDREPDGAVVEQSVHRWLGLPVRKH
ncbi:MAG: hypothetical protein WBE74_08980 [Terracidiphilus sp.]